MPHLTFTDTQLMLLSAASQRDDHLLTPPETLRGGAAKAVTAKLLAHSLVEEVPVSRSEPAWSQAPDGQVLGLRLTHAGLAALGLELHEATAGQQVQVHLPTTEDLRPREAGRQARSVSKRALLIELLSREEGASIADVVEVTGWLPHTTRAALTGLRQRGHAISRSKAEDGTSVYRLDDLPQASATGQSASSASET